MVQARFGDGRLTLGRNILHQEVGLAVGGHRVGRGHDCPVAMGEGKMAVLPGVRRKAFRIQLPGGEQRLRPCPPGVVAVDVDVGEPVERADFLEALIGPPQDLGIPESDVANGLRVPLERLGTQLLVVRERPHRDVGEAQSGSGGGDVALDERGLPDRLGRLDPEALDEGRVCGPHDHRYEHPQPDGDSGQDPAAPANVIDQQTRGQYRNGNQQIDGRQLRLHVGVGRAVDDTPGRKRDLEPVEVIAHRPDRAAMAARRIDTWPLTAGVTTAPGTCRRIPPLR